jgi:hypothetical protein
MDHEEISFKPITNGLGFHPFSDGLPYAPLGKNSKQIVTQGTGAVSAGSPKIILPKPRQQLPVIETQGETQGETPDPEVPSREPQQNFGWSYMGIRILAYFFDFSLGSLLVVGAVLSFSWKTGLKLEEFLDLGLPRIAILLFLFLIWTWITLQEFVFKVSLGKALFGLKLTGSRFGILVRALVFPISIASGCVGIFWALIHGSRSCWHDILTGIQPQERDRT